MLWKGSSGVLATVWTALVAAYGRRKWRCAVLCKDACLGTGCEVRKCCARGACSGVLATVGGVLAV